MDTSQDTTLNSLDSQLPSLDSSFGGLIAPFMILSTLLTVIFVAAYIASIVRKRKVENAILAMQKELHEMNERAKLQTQTTSASIEKSSPATAPPENTDVVN